MSIRVTRCCGTPVGDPDVLAHGDWWYCQHCRWTAPGVLVDYDHEALPGRLCAAAHRMAVREHRSEPDPTGPCERQLRKMGRMLDEAARAAAEACSVLRGGRSE